MQTLKHTRLTLRCWNRIFRKLARNPERQFFIPVPKDRSKASVQAYLHQRIGHRSYGILAVRTSMAKDGILVSSTYNG